MLGRFFTAVLCLLTGFAAFWSARLGYADYLALDHSPETTAHAIRLAPDNPDYYVQLAHSRPASALAVMRQAIALNPRNASLWTEFSSVAEAQNDPQLAEHCLLRAVDLDRTFAPRWLLAEFYARRHDPLHFWPAVHAALASSYDDITPLFDLCWDLAPQPAAILSLAIPPRPDVLRQYLNFLLAKDCPDLAAPVAAQLFPHAQSPDVPSLLDFCDRSLAQSSPQLPLAIWNALSRKSLIPEPVLSPARALSVTNGAFTQPFLQHAFDWRMPTNSGIFAGHDDSAGSVRFEFSGNQPESCDLLSQPLPLLPSRNYKLTVLYRTNHLPPDPGLSWVIDVPVTAPLTAPIALASLPLPPANSAPAAASTRFSTPASTESARLALRYRRSLGTVRAEGVLTLMNVQLQFAE